MKKLLKKLQNSIWEKKGSALIMVIICMLFVGIITSVVIVTASSGLTNVMLYKKGADNFYTAEHVLDELKNTLEDLADASVREAYQNWLVSYSYNTSSEQHEKFKKLFIKDYKQRLIDKLFSTYSAPLTNEYGDVVTPAAATVRDIIDILPAYAGTPTGFKEVPYFKPSSDDELILNVKLSYIEDDGSESVIETDLKFSINPEDFKINTAAGLNTAAADFAVITDGTLTNAGTGCTGSNLKVIGNIYGGGDLSGVGIDLKNDSGSGVWLYSDKILTRNTIKFSNGAYVFVKGSNGDYETPSNLTYGDIWAKNILFTNTAGGSGSKLEAQAHLYLADDLTINAPGSEFMLKGPKSSFYGYGADEINVDKSSAIVINSRNVNVNMEAPDLAQGGRIAIAGKSFISVPVKFGSSQVTGTTLQGESISYKGEQAAYLLPSECLIGIGHNPMTYDEFLQITDEHGEMFFSLASANAAGKNCYVNIGKSALSGGVDLGAYVEGTKPAKSFFVNYDDSTKMAYIYLNFKDSQSSTEYFKKFNELYPDTVKARTESLGGEIKINPLVLETVGNVTITTGSSIYPATKRTSDANMIMEQWNLSTRHNGLVNNLTDTYIGLGTQVFLSDNVVNMGKVAPRDIDVKHGYITSLGVTERAQEIVLDGETSARKYRRLNNMAELETFYYLYTGKNVTVKESTGGIIVASGDVYIENGASFTGLIVARGNIYCKSGNIRLKADPPNIVYIMEHCAAVREFFEVTNVTAGTGSGGEIISSDIVKIEFENWKKD